MFPLYQEHTIIIVAAVLLDWLAGDPRWIPHPVVFIGRLITFLEPRLRLHIRSELFGGLVLLLLTAIITAATAALLVTGAYALGHAMGMIVSIILSWSCLAARSLHHESGLVAQALEAGDINAARTNLSYIVGRDTDSLQKEEIWRGAVETVAENSSDGVIAPLLYLLLGGPVLGLVYKAVNTLDSMVGYKNERYLHFGRASARCDDLLNYIPARLTALLMVMTAPFVGLHSGRAWVMMRRDGLNHSSPNSGFPEAAAAGALGVRLGGTNWYFGAPIEKPTIGDPLKPLDKDAWSGAVRLMYAAEVLLLCCGLFAFSQN